MRQFCNLCGHKNIEGFCHVSTWAKLCEGMSLTKSPAQRKAAERQRQRDQGRVAVTVWIDPADRTKVARYIKRLNERADRLTTTHLKGE